MIPKASPTGNTSRVNVVVDLKPGLPSLAQQRAWRRLWARLTTEVKTGERQTPMISPGGKPGPDQEVRANAEIYAYKEQ